MQHSEDIADEIQIQLIRRNLTDQWLADTLGISRATLRRRMKNDKWRKSELALLTSLWGVNFHQNHTRTANGT